MKTEKTKNQQVLAKLNKEIYIIISSFALAGIILSVFFIGPAIRQIQRESGSLFSEKHLINIRDAEIAGAEEFKRNYETYSLNLEKISKTFIDSQNPLDFIEFLEKSALDSGIELEISPLFFSKEAGTDIASFQLISYGGFSDTMEFLERIEHSPNLIKIQNFTIKNSNDEKKAPQLEANFLIKILAKQ